MNKYIFFIIIILLLIIPILISTSSCNKFTNENIQYERIKNLYGPGYVYWPKKNQYLKDNFPNDIYFDKGIKLDFYNNCLKLPKNSAVIDCGAHIGDLSIPVAKGLSKNGRDDIIIYAIDPSEHKCNFIKKVAKYNNIKNIIIINCGLSNVSEILCAHKRSDNNTGGTVWNEKSNDTTSECTIFKTVDELIKNNIIKHKLTALHLDVEGHEFKVLKGINNFDTIQYISAEQHPHERVPGNKLKKFLESKNFKFIKRIDLNDIYIKI